MRPSRYPVSGFDSGPVPRVDHGLFGASKIVMEVPRVLVVPLVAPRVLSVPQPHQLPPRTGSYELRLFPFGPFRSTSILVVAGSPNLQTVHHEAENRKVVHRGRSGLARQHPLLQALVEFADRPTARSKSLDPDAIMGG